MIRDSMALYYQVECLAIHAHYMLLESLAGLSWEDTAPGSV